MKVLLTAALLLLASTVSAQAVDPKPIATFIAGSSADLATTLYALNTSPNVREGNPFSGIAFGQPGLIVVKTISTVSIALVIYKLTGQGHPTAAKWLGYVGGAALGSLALHNLKVLNEAQGPR